MRRLARNPRLLYHSRGGQCGSSELTRSRQDLTNRLAANEQTLVVTTSRPNGIQLFRLQDVMSGKVRLVDTCRKTD